MLLESIMVLICFVCGWPIFWEASRIVSPCSQIYLPIFLCSSSPLLIHSSCRTLPLRLLHPQMDDIYKAVCLHCHIGQMIYLQILLGIQTLAAFLFTIGYQTRFMSIISWYLYLSLTLRNTWLNFILDRYFHYLLFYSMFLPLDECYSISTLKTKKKNFKPMVVSPATVRNLKS